MRIFIVTAIGLLILGGCSSGRHQDTDDDVTEDSGGDTELDTASDSVLSENENFNSEYDSDSTISDFPGDTATDTGHVTDTASDSAIADTDSGSDGEDIGTTTDDSDTVVWDSDTINDDSDTVIGDSDIAFDDSDTATDDSDVATDDSDTTVEPFDTDDMWEAENFPEYSALAAGYCDLFEMTADGTVNHVVRRYDAAERLVYEKADNVETFNTYYVNGQLHEQVRAGETHVYNETGLLVYTGSRNLYYGDLFDRSWVTYFYDAHGRLVQRNAQSPTPTYFGAITPVLDGDGNVISVSEIGDGVSALHYEFEYDSSKRIRSILRYELGEPYEQNLFGFNTLGYLDSLIYEKFLEGAKQYTESRITYDGDGRWIQQYVGNSRYDITYTSTDQPLSLTKETDNDGAAVLDWQYDYSYTFDSASSAEVDHIALLSMIMADSPDIWIHAISGFYFVEENSLKSFFGELPSSLRRIELDVNGDGAADKTYEVELDGQNRLTGISFVDNYCEAQQQTGCLSDIDTYVRSYTYNETDGHLSSMEWAINADSEDIDNQRRRSVAVTYNADGNPLTEMTYWISGSSEYGPNSGTNTITRTYTYNDDGRLATLETVAAGEEMGRDVYEYKQYKNTSVTTYTYDTVGNLIHDWTDWTFIEGDWFETAVVDQYATQSRYFYDCW